MRALRGSRNRRRRAHGAIAHPEPLTILAGVRVPACAAAEARNGHRHAAHAPSPAKCLAPMSDACSSPRAPRPRTSADTHRGCYAGTGGRALVPYLPRGTAQNFASRWRVPGAGHTATEAMRAAVEHDVGGCLAGVLAPIAVCERV